MLSKPFSLPLKKLRINKSNSRFLINLVISSPLYWTWRQPKSKVLVMLLFGYTWMTQQKVAFLRLTRIFLFSFSSSCVRYTLKGKSISWLLTLSLIAITQMYWWAGWGHRHERCSVSQQVPRAFITWRYCCVACILQRPSQPETKEYVRHCEKRLSNLTLIDWTDWYAHKISYPWLLPCFNKYLSWMPDDFWDRTPHHTNLVETAHAGTNRRTQINLRPLEAIQRYVTWAMHSVSN